MPSEEKEKKDAELVFGPHRTPESDKAIARMMFGKNAEKMLEDLPFLFALWGLDLQRKR